MLRLVVGQLRRRGSRSLALLAGLLVACAGFAVLTSQTRQASLQVQGAVSANARSAYDILVRPEGSASPVEQRQGLVQAGFLSGIRGGISVAQWRKVEGLSDISVAAPVAVVGYVVPKIDIPADVSAVGRSSGRVLIRQDSTWRTDDGLSVESARPSYLYVTPGSASAGSNAAQALSEVGADGKTHVVCAGPTLAAPWTVQDPPTAATCLSRAEWERQVHAQELTSATDPVFPFPFLIEAIDPAAEARLAGLDRAVVSGTYLGAGTPGIRSTPVGSASEVPVLVASRPAIRLSVSYTMRQLGPAAADAVSDGAGVDSQSRAAGRVIASGTVDQDQAYRLLLGAMATPTAQGDYYARQLSYLYTAGPTHYQASGDPSVLHPATVRNPRDVWANPGGGDVSGSLVPAGADDTALRQLNGYQWNYRNDAGLTPPAFVKMGVFDAARLPGYSSLAAVPLGTYASTVLTGAGARDRQLLGDQPLRPSSNIAGYPQTAPLMLTTIDALPAFEDSSSWGALPGDQGASGAAPVSATAPISSIRVRVKGVTGVDATSRERVRLAAQQIHDATGLSVDITVGSSPTPLTVVLPAGQHGRPALTLTENWVRKGTALAILQAVDTKSLVLFVLVLVVCALFAANTVAASVRARRTEFGILASLGWPRASLFRLVVIELTAVAAVSGAGGTLLARGVGAAAGIPVTVGQALLALPAAFAVALVAGLIPAWQAAHAPPMEAVRPAVRLPARGRTPRTITALAGTNLTRNRTRSILAGAGLAVASAALMLTIGVLTIFHGAVVGTLLGDAVTVQLHGADYAAVAAMITLAGAGVANVLFLNIRERGTEIATLRALGWTETNLTQLVLTEGLTIGVLGALVGTAVGVVLLAGPLGAPVSTLVLPAVFSLLGGAFVAGAATLPPLLAVHRLPTAVLLTEE